MNTNRSHDDKQRAQLARALTAVKDLRSQLDGLERERAEPIAIVGLGCRYPGGVQDADSFWQLLHEGRDAISEVPADRWDVDAYYAADPAASGKMSTRCGGFLDRIDAFDPQFFGIAPREAASLDPQQRLLLEVAWESLEHAGLAPDRLRGSQTGVFIGISSNDYAHLLMAGGPERIDSYMGSGNAHSVAAGRLSYVFGFEGPSLAVDTACSSSLVTVHLACQSLRLGECEVALAGGVNVLLTPTVSINHSRARMLAPDGRCKAFDASADGFVRSEGCGLVVLKRLSRALADGDAILAVIRGSAINQDGHTSGLTVPSGPSQQAVVRRALAQAGLPASDVSYVEAHGTGTALGDPIELQALAAVFGDPRPGRPLIVGSVKTNFGHAEAAAGVAGLIKVVLALEHETIPANLHFREPTPGVTWEQIRLVVPAAAMPWPRGPAPRVAGVSSFGFGGTNAHVVVEEAPLGPQRSTAAQRPLHLLALSAQSDDGLQALAGRYAAYLAAHPGKPVGDVCHSANAGRAHLRHRLCAVAASGAELVAQLDAFVAARDVRGLVHAKAGTARAPQIAFLFTGQGVQYAGMGRALFETQATFRRDLERCAALLTPYLERPLLDVLYPETADGLLDRTEYTQPALFALEYCLAKLWLSWGVTPDLVIGHSLGEYVAACLAGVLSLEDGLRLVAARARLMQGLPGDGAMVAVFAGAAEVRAAIARLAPDVEIAAINGPQHVVVAGPRAGLAPLLGHFAACGVETRALNVSHAFHSALIEPMLTEFARVAASVAYAAPQLELVSNLTGEIATADLAGPDYWCRHAREPVRFLDGMRTLERQGVDVFVEIGPHPVLLGMGRPCVAAPGGAWLPSLRRGQDDWQTLLGTLSALYVRGVMVDWRAFDDGYAPRRVRVPTYPFQRQRYWAQAAGPHVPKPRDRSVHPLLGARQDRACQPDAAVWESELAAGEPCLLDDHRVFGVRMMPASGYVELALAACSALDLGAMTIEGFAFHQPLVVADETGRVVQTSLVPGASGSYVLHVHSRPAGPADGGWTLHASGVLRADASVAGAIEDLAALRARIGEALAPDALYAAYARHGVEFGPALRAVERLWRAEGEALGCLRLPDAAARDEHYWLHPVWLDACAQVLGAATPEDGATWLQAGIDRVRVHRRPDGAAWAHARLRPMTADPVRVADLRLLDESGEVLVDVTGLHARPADATILRPRETGTVPAGHYELRWLEQPRAASPCASVPSPAAIAAELRPQLERTMVDTRLIEYAHALATLDARAPAYVAAAFRQLGWRYDIGVRFSSDAAREALGIAPQYRRLLERLLAMLAQRGTLRRVGSDWVLANALPADDPGVATATFAAAPAEAQMLDRCGTRLADVLAGRCDPLPLLFPDAERTSAASIYSDSPGAAAMHGLLRLAIAALCRAWPADRPLRVLEIGAGTGGATAHVLPELPSQTEYVYTDISRGFFAAARARFCGYPFVRFETLDIERPPETQGFAGREFDVVIAFNVLHATRSLADSLAHVQRLLAPGALLLLLENTAPADWVDLIWGLTPGWWRFEDTELRPAYPLLGAERWRELLAASGFAASESVAADPARDAVMARQALLVARNADGGAATTPRRAWLLLADAGGVGRTLAGLLEARGDRALLASRAAEYARIGADKFALDPLAVGDFTRLLGEVAGAGPLGGIVHLWGLDASDGDGLAPGALMAESVALSASALHLIQALASLAPAAAPAVWLVTRGARPVGDPAERPVLGAATLCGIFQTIAREYPQLWGGTLDLDRRPRPDDAARILDELAAPDGEDQIALRPEGRFVARVAPRERSSGAAPVIRTTATYLISGGCGALGLETARWLVEQGARDLALVGRSGVATPAAREAIAALEGCGARIRVFRADVADEAALRAVLAEIAASGSELRGVVHAAGLPGRRALPALDVPALDQMYTAKVAGTWALHRATSGLELDFFVCFSSMVSLWGAREQGHYVAANYFIDLLAHYRRALGLPALCVNWGPLTGGGMLPPADVAELARIGVMATPLRDAPGALSELLAARVVQAAVVRIDWPLFQGVYQARGRCRLFDLVARQPRAGAVPPAPVLERLRDAPPAERREIVVEHVQATLAGILGLDASRPPDCQQSFFDLGMDSLTAMELRTQLQTSLAVSLPATLVFDYGTIDGLTEFLLHDVLPLPGDLTPPPAVASAGSVRNADVRGSVTRAEIARMTDEEVEVLLQTNLLTL